mgnify:CR=1 FL=1
MRKLIQTIKNIWKIEDLKTRILITLAFIAIYRFGSFVVIPGVDPSQLAALQAQTSDGLLGLLNMLHAWSVGTAINLLAPSAAFAPEIRAMEHPSFYETEGNGIVEKLFNYIKNSSGFLYLSILVVGTIISIIFTMLALIGVFKMISVLPPITVTTLLLLVGYFFAITGPIIGVKYRLPIEPLLTLFASYAVVNCKFFVKKLNLKKFFL